MRCADFFPVPCNSYLLSEAISTLFLRTQLPKKVIKTSQYLCLGTTTTTPLHFFPIMAWEEKSMRAINQEPPPNQMAVCHIGPIICPIHAMPLGYFFNVHKTSYMHLIYALDGVNLRKLG